MNHRLAALSMAASLLLLAAACGSPAGSDPSAAQVPARASFGEKRLCADGSRELIFDGARWVPHDDGVDAYYDGLDAAAPTEPDFPVLAEPAYPFFIYDAAHRTHAAVMDDCNGCHRLDGSTMLILFFDRPIDPATNQLRPAYIAPTEALPSPPLPSISGSLGSAGRTCSNVACHGVTPGTFDYFFYDEQRSIAFGGYVTTPAWGTTGNGCVACHGNPPRNSVWHSGQHAGGASAATNQCQTCHPDATGTNGIGETITNPALHRNGVVEVQARFRSSCFGCH